MKKLYTLIAAMFCCALAFSQEAEESETSTKAGLTDLQLILRADATPVVPRNGAGKSNFSFDRSSIYTIVAGDIGGGFSFYLHNHWFAPHPEELYNKTGHSDYTNWIDYAQLTYTTGNWAFDLGKGMIPIADWNNDPYDWEVSTIAQTFSYNSVQSYQYGINAAYTAESLNSTFKVNFATSPFGEKFFSSKKYSYSLNWTGEFGVWQPMASFTYADGYEGDQGFGIFAFGNKFNFDKFTVTLDYINMTDTWSSPLRRTTVDLALQYKVSEAFDICLKGGYESNGKGEDLLGWDETLEYGYVPTYMDKDYKFGSISMNIYPLRDNKDLRILLNAAINNYSDNLAMNIGVLYVLDFMKFINK